MVDMTTEVPKAPRWIRTEAGQWAWRERHEWRGSALVALSVQERSRLLEEAEFLRSDERAGEDGLAGQ